jgi:CRISPR-associated endonuclease/helicase Cas3
MSNDLRAAFQQMFNIENPHGFQIQVAEHLLAGKSVVLQAPTGSGKTWTALFPFLHALRTNLSFPRKCLYAVPLRVLATQFRESTLQVRWPNTLSVQIQTGEQPDDPTLESDLIFTTIDQVLSSALSVPYSLGFRRANLNAGAVFSSFLVCDEVHLFPIDEGKAQGALATTIELLRLVGDSIPFLLMTATLSDQMLNTLSTYLKAKRVTVQAEELGKIGSQQKTRRYHVVNASLKAESVLAQHKQRSIVICNQVQRAIDLFEDLDQAVRSSPDHLGHTHVALLHSRFIPEHRQETETELRQHFGKLPEGQQHQDSRIIIATQAIEVGLDITCERLHTELAPANAIIQRAGRCARYQGEEGDVLIYQLPDDVSQPHLPYDAARCAATWDAFSAPQFNSEALTFAEEQQIVTLVHDPADERLLKRLEAERKTRRDSVHAAMFRGDKQGRPALIRKVDSRTLLVHKQPKEITKPFAWRGFSIFHGTLRGWLANLLKEGATSEWILRYPIEVEESDQESRKRPAYNWDNYVRSPEHIHVSPVFVVHPDLVAYDRRLGFRLMPAETAIALAELQQEPQTTTQSSPFLTRYTLESYTEHIEKMLHYYEVSGLEAQIMLAGQRLERSNKYKCSAEQLSRAVRLAIALHDVGKLRVEWQQWSHDYQEEIGEKQQPDFMIVHTHYKPHDQQLGTLHLEAEKTVSKKIARPHHAAEGACASWSIILHALDGDEHLSRTVFTAIARHHAPFVDGVQAYQLHAQAQTAIAEALAVADMTSNLAQYTAPQGPALPEKGALSAQLIETNNLNQWLVYALIVRALRLCDGHALEGKE